MGLPQTTLIYTPDEYLAFERESEERHEYLDGQIYAMAGESPEHSTICVNLIASVVSQLRGKPCRAFSPNMKVRTKPTGLYSYPDLTVVCGEPVFHDDHRDVLVNPLVIIEVLSPSTEAYDRGGKFAQYQQITSLTDYLLVAQDSPRVEHYVRQANGQWLYSVVSGLSGVVEIASIGCRIPLSEIYDRITFSPPLQPEADISFTG
jgi:Uma2 family endonuclease